ncbi:MAG: SH3 domain-containing protein [Cocleimonas sp.]|nr:SH3 domain-containing protein [Cocleimonas sp.]
MTNYLSVGVLLVSLSTFAIPNITFAACSIIKTSSGALNVRKKASKTSAIIFKASRGSAVSVKKYYKNWVKVTLNNGNIGYVSRKHLNGKGECGLVRIDSGRLNIRKHSKDDSIVIDVAVRHSAIRILKQGYNWDKVKLNNGNIGYVVSGYVY